MLMASLERPVKRRADRFLERRRLEIFRQEFEYRHDECPSILRAVLRAEIVFILRLNRIPASAIYKKNVRLARIIAPDVK
jgi:hypothetical protein